MLAAEETEHEGLGSEYGAVDPAGAAGRHERPVLAAQAQEVAVQRHGLVVGLGLAPVELAGRERPRVVGSANDGLQLRGAQARELGDLLAAPLVDQLGQLALEAGEVEEGCRGRELLAHEQHRRGGAEEEQRGDRPQAAGGRRPVQAEAAAHVGELVVVLDEDDEPLRLEVEGRGAAGLLLPAVALALVEEAVLRGRDQLLRAPLVVAQVGLVAAGQRHDGAVVEVVVPQGVEAEAAPLAGPDEAHGLGLVLAHDEDPAGCRGLAGAAGELGQDVLVALAEVVDVLGGVDPEAVDVELVDPVDTVRDDEFAHRPAVRAVEVQRLAPVGAVAVGEVVGARIP